MNKKQKHDIEIARSLIGAHIGVREALKQIGIMRTNRSVIADYGEWLAANLLKLKLESSTIAEGYDALDSAGRRYEIKARASKRRVRPVYNFRRLKENQFDYAVLVELSPDLELLNIYTLPLSFLKKFGKVGPEGNTRLYLTREMLHHKDLKTVFDKNEDGR